MNQNDFLVSLHMLIESYLREGVDPFTVYNHTLEGVEEFFDETGLLSSEGLIEDE